MSIKIVVIGMGYAGIPVAALLADIEGFNVSRIQRRAIRFDWKNDQLNEGRSPIKNEIIQTELIYRAAKEKSSFRATDDITRVKKAGFIYRGIGRGKNNLSSRN